VSPPGREPIVRHPPAKSRPPSTTDAEEVRDRHGRVARAGGPSAGYLRCIALRCLVLSLLVLSGCVSEAPVASNDDDVTVDDDDATVDDDDAVDPECSPEGATLCAGVQFRTCIGGAWQTTDTCVEPTPLCEPDRGCLACEADALLCDGNDVVSCDDDGLGTTLVESCPADLPCVAGACTDLCAEATAQLSYFGCDFLAVSTANVVSTTFHDNFAVVVANPAGSGAPAQVSVSRDGSVVAEASVAPGDTEAITLPMVLELKAAIESAVVPGGAYEVHSTVPVAAYQFNPLDFELNGADSLSNDASLLLPEHSLGTSYMVSHWPTFGLGGPDALGSFTWYDFAPGFYAVAATADGTTVTLGHAGRTSTGTPPPAMAGETATVSLDRGDVVQVFSRYDPSPSTPTYCADEGWQQTTGESGGVTYTYCFGSTADLTGSTVTATAPVSVTAGHLCTFVPYDQWACDHLEEAMIPTAAWGTTAVLSAPALPNVPGAVARAAYRVLALGDGTTVTFDPPITPSMELDAGDARGFSSDADFVLTATGPVFVTQTLMGQDAIGANVGDPAMGLGVPWSQVRSSYDILAPATFTQNWLNVVALDGEEVTLNGAPIGGWQAIGATGFVAARVELDPGGHHLESTGGSGFGITSYGYGRFASYLLPGGMNFTR